jgi:hypothetical protein
MNDDLKYLLDDDSSKNEPAPIRGTTGGMTGRRDNIQRYTDRELRIRRQAVAKMLISGYSRDYIVEAMGRDKIVGTDGKPRDGFNMSEREVDRTIALVRAEWEEESEDTKRYAKEAAQRRILTEIEEARRDKAHTALANLEKVLMQIQGTAEPIEIQQPGDSRVADAVLRTLGELDVVTIRVMIEKERTMAAGSDLNYLPKLSSAEMDADVYKRKKLER